MTSRSPTAQTLAAAETPGPRSPDEPHPGDTLPPSHIHQAKVVNQHQPSLPPQAHHTVAQTHQSRTNHSSIVGSPGDSGRPRKRGKLTVGAPDGGVTNSLQHLHQCLYQCPVRHVNCTCHDTAASTYTTQCQNRPPVAASRIAIAAIPRLPGLSCCSFHLCVQWLYIPLPDTSCQGGPKRVQIRTRYRRFSRHLISSPCPKTILSRQADTVRIIRPSFPRCHSV